MSVWAKFEGCAAKTVGGVEFLRVTGFSKKVLLPNFASWLPVWSYRLQAWRTCPEMLYTATLQVWRTILDGTGFLM